MQSIRERLHALDRLAIRMINLWVLVLIATPVVAWVLPSVGLLVMIPLGVLVQSVAVSVLVGRSSGWRTVLTRLLPVLPLAWLVEFLGSRTGIPFGRYDYTSLLQPQLAGVPVLIPLAWLMMLPPAWAVADLILGGAASQPAPLRRLLHAALSALAFTAWDLYLDPQMVAWGVWRWEQPGSYFGIPLSNYLGWLLVSFLLTWILAPGRLPREALLVVYVLTWFLQAFGQGFFWGQPGPALAGFLAMGGMIAWAARRSTR